MYAERFFFYKLKIKCNLGTLSLSNKSFMKQKTKDAFSVGSFQMIKISTLIVIFTQILDIVSQITCYMSAYVGH